MKPSESWLQQSENTARRELKVGTKGANPASQAVHSCSWQCPQVGQDVMFSQEDKLFVRWFQCPPDQIWVKNRFLFYLDLAKRCSLNQHRGRNVAQAAFQVSRKSRFTFQKSNVSSKWGSLGASGGLWGGQQGRKHSDVETSAPYCTLAAKQP